MGNLIGLLILLAFVAWVVMLAVGNIGIGIGFLHMAILLVAARIIYFFITYGV